VLRRETAPRSKSFSELLRVNVYGIAQRFARRYLTVKGARTVIIIETVLLIAAVWCINTLYSRSKAEARAKDQQLTHLQEAYDELVLRYKDVNLMYEELREEMATVAVNEPETTVADASLPTDIGDLQRELVYERRRYGELEHAFDQLVARVDQYVQRSSRGDQQLADVTELKKQAGLAGGLPPDAQKRLDDYLDRRIVDLQKRIESSDDPRLQQNFADIGNTLQNMRDIQDRMRNARSKEDRRLAEEEMRVEQRQMSRLLQEERKLQMQSLAQEFNVPEDRMTEFARRVNRFSGSTDIISKLMPKPQPQPRTTKKTASRKPTQKRR